MPRSLVDLQEYWNETGPKGARFEAEKTIEVSIERVRRYEAALCDIALQAESATLATGNESLGAELNFKAKYAPDFPVLTLRQVNPGRTIAVAALEQAGLIAPAQTVSLPQPA